MRTPAQDAASAAFMAAGRAAKNQAAYLAGLRAGRAGKLTDKPASGLVAPAFNAGLRAGFRGALAAARRRSQEATRTLCTSLEAVA